MGKSIRSKRLKRLRTLKRELVTPHYDEKELAKMAAMEAALAAPKLEIPKKRSQVESMETEEQQSRGRTGQSSSSSAMAIDDSAANASGSGKDLTKMLRVRGGIKKRGKSQGRLKKERHHKQKLNF